MAASNVGQVDLVMDQVAASTTRLEAMVLLVAILESAVVTDVTAGAYLADECGSWVLFRYFPRLVIEEGLPLRRVGTQGHTACGVFVRLCLDLLTSLMQYVLVRG